MCVCLMLLGRFSFYSLVSGEGEGEKGRGGERGRKGEEEGRMGEWENKRGKVKR